ncbi:hypothetical protein [Rhizobium sp. 768_B6_N1_8]|uniref:hypothetical protein n=1 Tax=unclassified Rhizobium TaxID=2613769 RepID=UPI003F28DB85
MGNVPVVTVREMGRYGNRARASTTRPSAHEEGDRRAWDSPADATGLGGVVEDSWRQNRTSACLTFRALPPSTDAAHIHNAAITLPYGNLEPAVASAGPINEETTTAVDPPDVPETAAAEQPLALTAGNPSATVEIGADADGDLGLRACFGRHGY